MFSPKVFVDDVLHGEIRTIFCNYGERKGTIVLLSGDGNANKDHTHQSKDQRENDAFPPLMQDAMVRGFHVEVWSWKNSLSSEFLKLQDTWYNEMTIKFFDDYMLDILVSKPHPNQPLHQNLPNVLSNQRQSNRKRGRR